MKKELPKLPHRPPMFCKYQQHMKISRGKPSGHKIIIFTDVMNATEPNFWAKTLEFHFGKNHLTFLSNLNKLILRARFENVDTEPYFKYVLFNFDCICMTLYLN